MPEKMNYNVINYLKHFSEYSSIILIIIGILILIGWAFDIAILKSPSPNFSTIKSNVALCFILIGVSLWLQQTKRINKRYRQIAQILAVIVALIGFFTLIEHLFNINLGIDQILFTEPSGALNTSAPNRMAFLAALELLIIGTALLILDKKIGKYYPAQILMLIEGILAFTAIMGYVYGTSNLYMLYNYTATAIYAAITFMLIFFAVLSARPDKGFMKVITGEGLGSAFGRKILPVVIIIPILLGGLWLLGEKLGYYDESFSNALLVISTVLILAIVVWMAMKSLNKIDIEHQKSQEKVNERTLELEKAYSSLKESEIKFKELFDKSTDMISLSEITEDGLPGKYIEINEVGLKRLGYTKEEMLNMGPTDIIAPDKRVEMPRNAVEMDKKGFMSFEIVHLTKEGKMIPVEINGHIIKYQGRDVYLTVSRDITERKKAENKLKETLKELERSNQELEQFAYVSSHDLQEPLRTIASFTQLLERRYKGKFDSDADEFMDFIVEAAIRMKASN